MVQVEAYLGGGSLHRQELMAWKSTHEEFDETARCLMMEKLCCDPLPQLIFLFW